MLLAPATASVALTNMLLATMMALCTGDKKLPHLTAARRSKSPPKPRGGRVTVGNLAAMILKIGRLLPTAFLPRRATVPSLIPWALVFYTAGLARQLPLITPLPAPSTGTRIIAAHPRDHFILLKMWR